jgi:hypothetical protein
MSQSLTPLIFSASRLNIDTVIPHSRVIGSVSALRLLNSAFDILHVALDEHTLGRKVDMRAITIPVGETMISSESRPLSGVGKRVQNIGTLILNAGARAYLVLL